MFDEPICQGNIFENQINIWCSVDDLMTCLAGSVQTVLPVFYLLWINTFKQLNRMSAWYSCKHLRAHIWYKQNRSHTQTLCWAKHLKNFCIHITTPTLASKWIVSSYPTNQPTIQTAMNKTRHTLSLPQILFFERNHSFQRYTFLVSPNANAQNDGDTEHVSLQCWLLLLYLCTVE